MRNISTAGCASYTMDCLPDRQPLLVVKGLSQALQMASVEHTGVLAVEDRVQRTRATAENRAWAGLESDDSRKALRWLSARASQKPYTGRRGIPALDAPGLGER
jgi:hypothetical protein